MIETSEKILDAAERLFAEGGYAATSLRSIMAEAGVNVAAIHYYFRSKESLLEAVLMRRAEPANQERLRVLEEYEESAKGCPLEVERILEAFLYPTFRVAGDPAQGGDTFVRFLGRLQAESDLLPNIVFSRFGPVLMKFADALARALPELPPNDLYFRARLAMGATAQLLRDAPRLKDTPPDWTFMLQRLVPFLSAGFRAPIKAGNQETPRYQIATSSQENE
jgi:AcrR family transcriptional regulator